MQESDYGYGDTERSMGEAPNATEQPDKTKRRRRLPWDEFAVVVKDPHLDGKLLGMRGRIEAVSGGSGEPFEYFVNIEAVNESFSFRRDQLESTGEPTFVLPPKPWTRE